MKISKKIAKGHEDLRKAIGNAMLKLLQSTGLIIDADKPITTDFHYEGDSVFRYTFSISNVKVQIPDRTLDVDNLEIDVIFDIDNVRISDVNVRSDGIEWNVDEQVSIDQFNDAEKHIQKILEREILKRGS